MEITPKLVIGCSLFCVILITSICLFACSFGVVELDKWAIVFDKNVQEIEADPYSAGRYLIGLGKKFITFPRRLIFMESRTSDPNAQTNTLDCWTKDGINLYIEMNFYFKLEPHKLRDMYFQFGDDWYGSIVRLSQTSIVETTTKFNTTEYFTSRQMISDYMKQQIQDKMDKFTYGTVIEFNLRQLSFDTNYQDAITKKLIQYQEKKTLEINKTIAQILKETEFLEADAQANGTIILANATSLAFKTIVENEAQLYKNVADTFGFSDNSTQLLHYIYVDQLQEAISDYRYFLNPQNSLINFNS